LLDFRSISGNSKRTWLLKNHWKRTWLSKNYGCWTWLDFLRSELDLFGVVQRRQANLTLQISI
jgi:hypothetical protein